MRFFKRTIQWTIGILCGLFLSLQLALNIPLVQKKAGAAVSSLIKKYLDWDIQIGKIQMGLGNRIIIDDIKLADKQDSLMIYASRIAAKINLMPLAKGEISIANAQIFGASLNLYQTSPEENPNFSFIADLLFPKKEKKQPVDLHIGSLLVRRTSVNWNRLWEEGKATGQLDPNHLELRDIALTAHIRKISKDSVNVAVKRLALKEKNGFMLKKASMEAIIGQDNGTIRDFNVELKNSSITLPYFESEWTADKTPFTADWLKNMEWNATIYVELIPSDLKSLVPQLTHAHSPITASIKGECKDGTIRIPQFNVSNGGSLVLNTNVTIENIAANPEAHITITRLHADKKLQKYITKELEGTEREISPIINNLDTVSIHGNIKLSLNQQECKLRIINHSCSLDLTANITDANKFEVKVSTRDAQLKNILSSDGNHKLEEVSLDMKANGVMKNGKGSPEVRIIASLPHLAIDGNDFNNGRLTANLNRNFIGVDFNLNDGGGKILADIDWNRTNTNHIYATISIDKFDCSKLGLGKRYPDQLVSISTTLDLKGSEVDDISGQLDIRNVCLESADSDTVFFGPWHLALNTEINKNMHRRLNIESNTLNLSANGKYRFTNLTNTIQNLLHKKMPNIIPGRTTEHSDTIYFKAEFQDTTLLDHILLADIKVPRTATIMGNLLGNDSIQLYAHIPSFKSGKVSLDNTLINISGNTNKLTSLLQTDLGLKNGVSTLSFHANAQDSKLSLNAGFDNHSTPKTKGSIGIAANIMPKTAGDQEINVSIAPSELIIADTLWNIAPSSITWKNRHAMIREFKLNNSFENKICIDGVISAEDHDTLKVKLNNIDLGYVLDLVEFHDVSFKCLISGEGHATRILSEPLARIDLRAEQFLFNDAPQGRLEAKGTWGYEQHVLGLEAVISDTLNQQITNVNGGFNIGDKSREDGLDLRIHTKNFNLAFLNFFTKDIFEDFKGRGSGYCRVFGPFTAVDIEGDVLANYASCTLPMLGTTYKLEQDSVRIRPGKILISAHLMDEHFKPSATVGATKSKELVPHTALLKGELTHDKFKDLTYNFNAKVNNFLGYHFTEFGEEPFYATCFATGDIAISGIPGQLTVDINATPEAGTEFTYNVSTPEALTEAKFIKFVSNTKGEGNATESTKAKPHGTEQKTGAPNQPTPLSDLFLNFNLQITPAAKMRLLMDPKSGDMIEMMGGGRIMAKYHNRGNFNLYGTYRVEDGSYRLSLQEIIRKEFKFEPGGTVTFGGDPMKADINMKAIHSVPSVSIDDLTNASLGFSKTRVDCILNLSGHPEQPAVSFDFNLPDATEDERQMVRSILSTEEERNTQTIYLLGLGRFINYDSQVESESSAAINSLVSTTLSSQINQFISDAVGRKSNWSFGTNLKTGDDGWRNIDVEGMLSGSLLDNRLLLTGNFGYREKYYTQRSLITDVSVEYLLTKNGNISIKAYNMANDRYFVQSSLNTQGIGIQFKKDFNRISDLYFWKSLKTGKNGKKAKGK